MKGKQRSQFRTVEFWLWYAKWALGLVGLWVVIYAWLR